MTKSNKEIADGIINTWVQTCTHQRARVCELACVSDETWNRLRGTLTAEFDRKDVHHDRHGDEMYHLGFQDCLNGVIPPSNPTRRTEATDENQ